MLSEALNHAIRNNPRIQALIANWEVQIEMYRQKTALPDPMINFTYFPSPIETKLGPQDYNIQISQGIPFPGKLDKKGKIVEKQVRVARRQLDKEVKNIRAEVIKSYAELSYIQNAKIIAVKNMELMDALVAQAQNIHAQDKGLLMDIMRGRSQKGQMQYDLILLEQIEKTQQADLNALMNRPVEARIGKTEKITIPPVKFTPSEIFAKTLENNDTIKIFKANVEKADARIDFAKTTQLPDFKLGLFYAGIGDSDSNIQDSGKDAVGIQFGLTIPLWSGKNSGEKMAALYAKKAALAEKKETENQILARVSKILFMVENTSRLIVLYEDELLPQAMDALNTSELWFNERKTSFSDFLEAQSVVHNFQLALARARADYIKNLADLENLAGIALTPFKSNSNYSVSISDLQVKEAF